LGIDGEDREGSGGVGEIEGGGQRIVGKYDQ
jgi:hypothetical protein